MMFLLLLTTSASSCPNEAELLHFNYGALHPFSLPPESRRPSAQKSPLFALFLCLPAALFLRASYGLHLLERRRRAAVALILSL